MFDAWTFFTVCLCLIALATGIAAAI